MYMFSKRLLSKNLLHLRRKYSKLGSRKKWLGVIGLEVHAQIFSKSKLFSGSANEFASPINNNVALFDCSIPGTLPILNKKCVEAGVLTALALNCRINPVSTFDRKHYFYADLPTGYQITQQRTPLAVNGVLEFQVYTPGIHKAHYTLQSKIKQLQLEQDSGKSLHEEDRSLIDLNRAGTPLMELVFEPDLTDGEEAAALVKELIIILQRIGVCSCKMEEGALRVDANVSVHQEGEPLGIRTEVKNIGSVRGVAAAIKFEIERQIKLCENGSTVINETRMWDAASKTTLPMRDKEQVQDYRYMPEPNLPPLHIALGPVKQGCVDVDELQKLIPELPKQTRTKLKEFGVTSEQAIILVNENPLLNLFEKTISHKKVDSKLLANILINDLLAYVNKEKLVLEEIAINTDHFVKLVEMLHNDIINRNVARILLEGIIKGHPDSPEKVVKDESLGQISIEAELEELCKTVVNENPKIVKQYKEGKTKVFKALLGLIASRSNQRANMKLVNIVLKKMLDK